MGSDDMLMDGGVYGGPRRLTPEEKAIIIQVEQYEGRVLTQKEINLALQQAREVGELPQINGEGPGYKVED